MPRLANRIDNRVREVCVYQGFIFRHHILRKLPFQKKRLALIYIAVGQFSSYFAFVLYQGRQVQAQAQAIFSLPIQVFKQKLTYPWLANVGGKSLISFSARVYLVEIQRSQPLQYLLMMRRKEFRRQLTQIGRASCRERV